jgi:UDP-glucose 4-epimerase
MKTVLITGANGFLGRYVARHFDTLGWRVIGVGRGPASASLREVVRTYWRWRLPDVRFGELLRETTPRLLVHCAGPSSVAESFRHAERDFANGPGLVFELLSQLRTFSPRTRFVFPSSAAVYGNPARLPVGEEHPLAPISPYASHKVQSEKLCRDFAKDFALRTAVLRIFSAYGPGLRRQVVWDIFQKATTQAEVVLQGTGEETRDFVHATDVARGVEQVYRAAQFHGAVYNLASGHDITIAELAERICRQLEMNATVRFDGVLPPGTPRHWRADVQRIRQLGFEVSVPLEYGLAGVAAWIRKTSLIVAA